MLSLLYVQRSSLDREKIWQGYIFRTRTFQQGAMYFSIPCTWSCKISLRTLWKSNRLYRELGQPNSFLAFQMVEHQHAKLPFTIIAKAIRPSQNIQNLLSIIYIYNVPKKEYFIHLLCFTNKIALSLNAALD